MTTYLGSGDVSTHRTDYTPEWLGKLADDVTLEAAVINGVAVGPEAVRAILGFARTLYDYQEFNVDMLLKHADVPKGSFYHHFGSKDQFAQRVLEGYHDFQMAQLARWSARTDLAVPERLRLYYLDMVERFVRSAFQRACLAGKFSSELAASSSTIRSQLSANFAQWRDGIADLLETGQRDGSVRTDCQAVDLADSVLALMQGAFVVAFSVRDEDSVRRLADSLVGLVAVP
jgi:TetR/AcrR family transcriptional repressor of nem operon